MGSFGDADGPIKPMHQNPNDSKWFVSSVPGEDVIDTSGLYFDDTVSLEDDFNSQALNFDEETQMWEDLDFVRHVPAEGVFETQVVDFGNETQVLDDIDNLEDIGSQLFDEVVLDSGSDGEGDDTTQVLCENDDFTNDGAKRGDERKKTELKMSTCILNSEFSEQSNHGFTNGHQSSRSVPRFGSIRVESIRASGLAAHSTASTCFPGSVPRFASLRVESLRLSALAACSAASKRTNSESCSQQTMNGPEQETVENSEPKMKVYGEADTLYGTRICDHGTEESRNRKKSNLGLSAARKLFSEDSFGENEGLSWNSENMVMGKVAIQLPRVDDGLSRLSYTDSQEPGELSQAYALACVEKLIEKSKELIGTDESADQIGWRRSDCMTSTNGHKNLAKKANQRGMKGTSGIFDWDDNREDEGGGDIFQKRKQDFLGTGKRLEKSFSEPKNANRCRSDGRVNSIEKPSVLNKVTICSDSRIYRSTGKQADVSFRGNLSAKFDKYATKDKMEAALPKGNVLETGSVDTKMTTEGIESSVCGVGTSELDAVDEHPVPSVTPKDPLRRSTRLKNNVSSNEHSLENSNDVGVTTMKLKRGKRIQAQSSQRSSPLSPKYPENSRKEFGTDLVMTRKRARETSVAQKQYKICGNTTGLKMCTRRGKAEETNDRLVQCRGYSLVADPRDSTQEVASFVPIAHRTRQSLLVSKGVKNITVNTYKGTKKKTFSSVSTCPDTSSMERIPEELPQNANEQHSSATGHCSKSFDTPRKLKAGSLTRVEAVKLSNGKSDGYCSLFVENELNSSSENLISKPSDLECASPIDCTTHVNAVSPVCMGDGYVTLSGRKNKEISSLCEPRPKRLCTPKNLRKKRDLTAVRVLFSHHLENDVIKRQQKIMDQLKITTASSINDATHFITDKFLRTRNILEAIASGKPVVTPLWLENIRQAKCYLDEENYVLRDLKKECEMGFKLPASLALARQHPLLEGKKVLITSNARPSKEILSSLVQKVHGQPIDRVGRSVMKDGMTSEDLLILTCEDDYEACVPFLEKGIAVYSSELLLNGIVTQKLEYERYQLFQDKVKRTRSTIRMKKDCSRFVPVSKR